MGSTLWCPSSLVDETFGGEVAWRGGGGGGGGITVESSKAENEGSILMGCLGKKVVKLSTCLLGELSLDLKEASAASCGRGVFKALTAAAAWPSKYKSWISGFWLSTAWSPSSWGRSKTVIMKKLMMFTWSDLRFTFGAHMNNRHSWQSDVTGVWNG